MYFFDAVRVVGRRWYIVVPLLVLTAVASLYMLKKTPASYVATGDTLLLPPNPPLTDAAKASNPYIAYFPSLSTVGEVVSSVMDGPTVSQQLKAEGAGKYTIGLSTAVQDSPIVTVGATASSPEQATRSVELVMASFDAHLAAQQASVGAQHSSYVYAQNLTPPNPVKETKSRNRVLAAVLGLGLVFSFGMAFFAESLAVNWRSRRSRTAGRPGVTDPEGIDESPVSEPPVPAGVHLFTTGRGAAEVSQEAWESLRR